MVLYSRTRGTGVTEDVAVTTHDFRVADNDPWPGESGSHYSHIVAAFQSYWNGLVGDGFMAASVCKPVEMRLYREDDDTPPWGSPAYVGVITPTTTPSNPALPPQVACSITEFTDVQYMEGKRQQRHWGRYYLPGLSISALASDGSLASGVQDSIANRTQTLYEAWHAARLQPIVRATNIAPNNVPAFLSVKEIRVDNVLDIIRSRRYGSVTRRVTRDVPDPFDSP
jgi:hypothetical protein